MTQRVLAIVGPTASGKSALALTLAEKLGCEIVSCDSMQIYRGMDIGTAKPTPEERERVRHHMIDVRDPGEDYSAAEYGEDAARAVAEIFSRGKIPLFCGGTGLYLDAALTGRHAEAPAGDPAFRAELLARGESEEGRLALYRELKEVDPESAAATHPNNLRRVVRALEIYRVSGIPKSAFDRASRELPPQFDSLVIGIGFADRKELYRRIERRVDAMMEAGLPEEAETLRMRGLLTPDSTAGQAIGYRQFFPYFEGRATLDDVSREIKTATRRYAKRQLTWFRAKPGIVWLDGGSDTLYADAERLCSDFLSDGSRP